MVDSIQPQTGTTGTTPSSGSDQLSGLEPAMAVKAQESTTKNREEVKNGEISQSTEDINTKVQPETVTQQNNRPQTVEKTDTEAQIMANVESAKQTAGQLIEGVGVLLKPVANQPRVTQEEKLFGGIAYIPMIQLISLMFKPDSAYVKLHTKQGLLIFGIFFFCIFLYIVPYLGPLFAGLIQLGMMILGVFSMYQAFIGNWWKIPVLGDISEVIPTEWLTQVTRSVVTGQATTPSDMNQNSGASDLNK